jgi:serine/threonine protein kinase
MTGSDGDSGVGKTLPLGGIGSAETELDTRPSGAPSLESAPTARVTSPLESARTAAAVLPNAFESARTALPTEPSRGAPGAEGVSLRPFGPYTRIETLGQQGNMGVVARGYNHAFGRWELLKFLKPELSHEAELLRQFRREGRALARLSHPNVVQVFAMYDLDAQPCIAMEFLEGLSLSAELERAGGRLTQERARELLLDAARGLSAAHELGLLHRDIKPDNLFVTLPGKGRVAGLKLIDFGLATADKARPEALQQDPSLASDATGGTPLFLAPEIWQGRNPTPRSDLYALGVSFFFAVTGRYPFDDTALHAVVSYCASPEPPPGVGQLRPDLSPAFASLLDRLIQKDPRARLESAEQLVAELVLQREGARPRRVPGVGPYRGLSSYSESERDVFFGRERDIAEVTERLRTQLGLLLVGPVGCGKSSLLRAGIAPQVQSGALGGRYGFEALVLEPRAQPLRALSAVLAPLLATPEADLLATLMEAPGELRALLEQKLAPERGLLLVVDQLEQLSQAPPAEAVRFARALDSLLEVESPRLRLLAAARSDLVDRLFALGGLRGLLTRGFHPLGVLADADLERALREPATTAGFRFEKLEILQELLSQTQGSTARLSLCSLALHRLWQVRDEPAHLLSAAAWQRLGGLSGVLIEHADAVFDSMGEQERAAAEEVVLRLISSTGKRDSSKRETLTDPAAGGEAARRALERLIGAGLCLEVAGEVELVHDALVTSWPRAQHLLSRVGVDLQLRQRVSQAAAQWGEQNEPEGLLWSGKQAELLLEWFDGVEQSFTLLELSFVEAVRRKASRERRLRRVGVALAAIGAVGMCSWLVVHERRLSQELLRTRERAQAARAAHERESAQLYGDRALLRLPEDPSGALRDAQAAGKLAKSALLDAVAWQALALGVPSALPLHPGGSGRVASDGEYVVTTGADALHVLRIRGTGSGVVALPRGDAGKPLAVSALVLFGDAWLGTPDGAVYRVRINLPEGGRSPEELQLALVGKTRGAVRELLPRERSGHVYASFAREDELALYDTGAGKLTELWHGAARDLALDAAGKHLAIVTPDGEVLSRALDAPGEPQSLGKHAATAVAFLGERVLIGDESGRLQLLGPKQETIRSRFTLGAPVQRLWLPPSERALLAQTPGGVALLATPALSELARMKTGSPAVHFLEPWRAIALIDEQQVTRVLAYESGQELGRLRGSGAPLTSLGSSDSWLFTGSLDGGVRAFPLLSSLPRPLAPAPAGTRSAVSAGGLVVDLGSDQASFRPLQGDAATPASLQRKRTAPSPGAAFSVGAGAVWTRGARGFYYFSKKVPLSGHTLQDIQQLWALNRSEDVLVCLASDAEPGKCDFVRLERGRPRGSPTRLDAPPLSVVELGESNQLLLLSSSGSLQRLSEVGAVPGAPLELPAGTTTAALAASRDGSRFAIGYRNGGVAVGAVDAKRAPELYRVTDASISCVAFGRDERVLVVGDDQGEARALDLDTGRAFVLLNGAKGALRCGYDPGSERFVFLDATGNAWTRALDTTPLSFLPPVDDPLAADERRLELFRGLEPAPK